MKKYIPAFLLVLLTTSWVFGQPCAGLFAPSTACAGVDINLHADGPTPATYSWTLPSGATLVSGTLTSPAITVRWGNGAPGSTNPYNSTVTCNYGSATCNLFLSKTVSVSKQATIGPPGQPSTSGQLVCMNTSFQALSVTASGVSPLTYQWYSNTTNTNTGGTLITGATNSSFTPSSSTVGTKYYYVIVSGPGGCGKTSIVSGAITVMTCISEALSFNGAGYYVNIPDPNGSLNLGTGPFTLEAYVKLTANPERSIILSKRTYVGGTPQADGFIFGFLGGNPFIQLQGTPNIQTSTYISLADGNCHHVAVRRSGTTISFFIDGVFWSNGNFTSNRDISSPGPSRIGAEVPTAWAFPGWIGEVRIWNIALTNTQIQNNLGLNLSPRSGLIAYYDMRDAANSQTLTDLSKPNGSNGTLGSTTSIDSNDPTWLSPSQVTCAVGGNFRIAAPERSEIIEVDSTNDVSFIKEVSSNARVYPNPTAKFVTIQLSTAATQPTAIKLFDVMGNEHIQTTFEQGESQKIIDVSALPSGTYVLRVGTSQTILSKKIIILKE